MLIQCRKCSKTHLGAHVISKFFRGFTPDPLKRAGEGKDGSGMERERERKGEEEENFLTPTFSSKATPLCVNLHFQKIFGVRSPNSRFR
jgi:hypothetical protein